MGEVAFPPAVNQIFQQALAALPEGYLLDKAIVVLSCIDADGGERYTYAISEDMALSEVVGLLTLVAHDAMVARDNGSDFDG